MTSEIGRPVSRDHRDGGRAWAVAVILTLCLIFSNLDRSILSLLVVPIEHQFKINDTALGLIQGTAFSLFYCTFGLLLSRAADNSHRRNLILIGLVVWCGATIGCGLSIGPKTLFAARVVVAFGEAILLPAGVSMLADYFSQRYRSRAFATYSLGSVLGSPLSLVVGALILRQVGKGGVTFPVLGHLEAWRVVFVIVGAAGLLLVPPLLFVREPPRLDELGRAANAKLTLPEVLRIFNENRIALIATIVGFGLISLAGVTLAAWAPTLFVRTHHWDTATVGLRLGLLSGGLSLIGVALGGVVSDKLYNQGRLAGRLTLAALASVFGALASVLITLQDDRVALVGAMMLFIIFAVGIGTAQAAISQLLPNRARGLGSSLFIAIANISAAFCGPLLVGALTDHVFHDPAALPLSLRIVLPVMFTLSAVTLLIGLRPYRDGVSRQQAEHLAAARSA